MFRTRGMALTPVNLLPGGKFFLMPFVPFLEPVRPTISPEIEVDIELVRNNMLKLTNGETNQLRSN
jgi:hypothetical protein